MTNTANDGFKDEPMAGAQQGCFKDLQPPVSKVNSAYFANKIASDPSNGKTTPVQLSFEKITMALLGESVFIVTQTSDLRDGTFIL